MLAKEISHSQAAEFLLPRHYAGRLPVISKSFGWFDGDELKAVCTFGKPATPSLCKGVCGEEYSSNVYELNRLCRTEDCTPPHIAVCRMVLKTIKTVELDNCQLFRYGNVSPRICLSIV